MTIKPQRIAIVLRNLIPLFLVLLCLLTARTSHAQALTDTAFNAQRMTQLVQQLSPSPLKDKLAACLNRPPNKSQFSIAHRGAPLRYAEHTRESYLAAASQGAGIVECDVTFTQDRQLVCRHSQCDLHSTTNILKTPLASSCRQPFSPATESAKASVRCCTSDITAAQFLTLKGRSDSVNPKAATIDEYLQAPEREGGARYVENATLMTHRQSIELFRKLGVSMMPELKAPQVDMPFGKTSQGEAYTQEKYAEQMIREYEALGISPDQVFPQSFNMDDIRYWLKAHPTYGAQAIYLDGRYRGPGRINPMQAASFKPSMQSLADDGLRTIAPPLWMLLTTKGNDIVPSEYTRAAQQAGLRIVTWTLERSGDLGSGGGWYYQSVRPQISSMADMFRVLDVLAQAVNVDGVFSDWPATTTFYANCMGLK
ncbi:MAG: glycerophosphodiester phosphodiesterase family protein [Burkholderiaceae bacterium]